MADGGLLFCYSIRRLARRQLSIPRTPPMICGPAISRTGMSPSTKTRFASVSLARAGSNGRCGCATGASQRSSRPASADHLPQMLRPSRSAELPSTATGALSSNQKSKASFGAAWKVSTPKSPRCSHCCAAVSRKRRRVCEGSGHAHSDYSGADVEQSYSPSFEKPLALYLIAFIAILGPFHPMISSFLSSSSSVAMKNFSSSC